MKNILVLAALVILPVMAANWAVLVAGSYNYYNYRHQSDVFHAYQVLTKRGFSKNNIIVLAYDDIAKSSSNPFPGRVFNKPTYKEPGVDVYEGVEIDYKGLNVTPKVFMNVLLGNSTFVKDKGTGRVLQQTPQDNIFIFFSDHGSPGSISFPNDFMYADELVTTLKKMNGTFNKLVFYLETCESGSMFVNLPDDIKVYALSAASPSQSSWATYCSPDDVIAGKHIMTCLGDLFSVSFIQDLEVSNSDTDTLQDQFERVKTLTTDSKVMQWGDKTYGGDNLNSIFGSLRKSNGWMNGIRNLLREKKIFEKVSTYHVKINYLLNLYKHNKSADNFRKLNEEMAHMKLMDGLFAHLKHALGLKGEYDGKQINYDCLRKSVEVFQNRCSKLEDYNLQYMKYFAENCQNNGHQRIIPILKSHCK